MKSEYRMNPHTPELPFFVSFALFESLWFIHVPQAL